MPTYHYRCSHCSSELETMQSIKDPPLTTCPQCGRETFTRVISAGGGMIFKGSGFYVTDYTKKTESSDASVNKQQPASQAPAVTPTPPPAGNDQPT